MTDGFKTDGDLADDLLALGKREDAYDVIHAGEFKLLWEELREYDKALDFLEGFESSSRLAAVIQIVAEFAANPITGVESAYRKIRDIVDLMAQREISRRAIANLEAR